MPGRGLNLLSLDGGGIRGLSSLQILKTILERVAREQGLQAPPKPCDFFDMIGGTSTGGLIAIMLGRMKMSIEECMEAYTELSDKVFRQTHSLSLSLTGKVRGKFDSKALEDAVKQNLIKHSLPEDCLLQDVGQASCKVFVCATSGSTRQTVILSSYSTERTNSDRLKYTKIWQAARATSAASGFFDPIDVRLGSYKESYTDGATGANNPINYLWHEAKEAFLEPGENLEDNLDCIISIGTGIPAIEPFGSSLKTIAKSIVAISTETENTAKVFRRTHENLVKSERYFRFNVSHGLEVIGLERVDRKDDIVNITNLYLDSDETHDLIQTCVKTLIQHEGELSCLNLENNGTITLRKHRTVNPGSNLAESALVHINDRSLVQRGPHALLDNISFYDPETRLLSISTRVLPGTARWILKNKDFIGWIKQGSSPFFLCTGIVGSGKTMIASLVTEYILRRSDPSRYIIAHYFLDPKYPRELSATALLRGLIRQIVSELQRAGRLSRKLISMLQELFGSRTVFYSSPELHRILQSLLAACHKCVIIVDGLHEMTEKDIFALLGIFRQLSSQRSLTKRIRFGIFCREQAGRNVNIETALPNVIHLNLTLDLLEKDIAYFIDESIRQKTMYERQLTDNEAVLEDVRSILKENGERMFLWIDLQLRTIWDTCFNDEAIRLALSGLPLGIEDTYSRCLSRMSQDDITRQYGHRILYLTAHVQRPLSQVELREAISVQEMFDYWDDLKTIRGQLLQYCANLVEQDHLTAVIRFVHPSVKTFLETHFHPTRYQSASILTGKAYTDANNFVTIGMEYCRDVCFKYLTMHDFGMQVAVRHTVQTNFATAEVLDKIMQGGNRMTRWTGRQFLKMRNPQARSHMTLDRPKRLANNLQENATVTQGYRLLAYVQEYWPSHARSLQPTDPAWPTFVGIAAAMHSPYRLHPWMQPGMSPIQFQRGLFCYAIQNNNMPLLWALVKECNKKRVAPLTELIIDEGESRACHLAASKGLDDMLKWLIQVGGPKQLTIKDARGDTALHASASSGNVKILELILEHLSAKDLLTDRNNRGDVPLVLAAMNGQSQYITKAVQAVKNLRSSKQRTQVLQDVLASILRYHPNAMDRLSALELCIETIVAALLDVHRDVSWMELVGLALDDDVLLFFDLFLDHPNSRAIIKGSLKNEPPDAPSGTSILGRACTISRSTKPERARIVELLLEHLPDEVTWQTVIENENAEKVNIITPVSLALSRVAVSEVAVEVVSILSNQLLKLSQQRKYVPQMIQEIGRPSDGDLDHLELLQRIHPSSVENFLISGALKLQQHFVDMPKTNLLHVAVMQESSALLQAIYNYGAQQNNANILYSLTAPSDTDETALMMAINGGKELHTHYTLAIAAQCLKFDDVFFAQRYKDGQVFRGQLTKLLVELFNGIPRVLENARSRDWKNSMDTVGLAESLHGRVTSAENYIQSWGYPRFKLSVELQLRALPRTEEQPESQTPQQSDSQEPQHPGSQTLQHAGNPQQQTVQGRQHS